MENRKKPPGRSTRWISASTDAWSGISISDMKAVAKSKTEQAAASALIMVTGHPASLQLRAHGNAS